MQYVVDIFDYLIWTCAVFIEADGEIMRNYFYQCFFSLI